MFRFGSVGISEIGDMISSKLAEDGVTTKCELYVYLNDDEFKKVDEDLFFRNNDSEEEFIPSDKEIDVNFDGVKIIIKKIEGNEGNKD